MQMFLMNYTCVSACDAESGGDAGVRRRRPPPCLCCRLLFSSRRPCSKRWRRHYQVLAATQLLSGKELRGSSLSMCSCKGVRAPGVDHCTTTQARRIPPVSTWVTRPGDDGDNMGGHFTSSFPADVLVLLVFFSANGGTAAYGYLAGRSPFFPAISTWPSSGGSRR